jgi:hypothetical protein
MEYQVMNRPPKQEGFGDYKFYGKIYDEENNLIWEGYEWVQVHREWDDSNIYPNAEFQLQEYLSTYLFGQSARDEDDYSALVVGDIMEIA